MIEFYSLGSSSRGNAFVIRTGEDVWLVDAGLTSREIVARLRERRVDITALAGIWITHEHGDHIRGLAGLQRRFSIPIYISSACLAAADLRIPADRTVLIQAGQDIQAGTATVRIRAKSHDAVDPLLFTFFHDGLGVSVITDLGRPDAGTLAAVREADGLILEANHDEDMLRRGPYPAFLKRRIAGYRGHLSNSQAAHLVGEAASLRLRHILLAHISQHNNTPAAALAAVARSVASGSRSTVPQLTAAPSCGGTPPVRLGIAQSGPGCLFPPGRHDDPAGPERG